LRGLRRTLIGRQAKYCPTKNMNLAETIEVLKTRERVALQTEPKRDHADNDPDSDDYSGRGQGNAQFRLAQVTQSELQNV
jgi:hypothetical protein